mgnify:CR=1 FL=1
MMKRKKMSNYLPSRNGVRIRWKLNGPTCSCSKTSVKAFFVVDMVNVPISGGCEFFKPIAGEDDVDVRREKCKVSVNHSLPPVISPIVKET